jgi:hypothetical protein
LIFLSLKTLRKNGGFFVKIIRYWLADILPRGLFIRNVLIGALLLLYGISGFLS